MDNIKTLKSDILERLEASHKEALRICESTMQTEREKIIKELDDRSAVLLNYPNLFSFDKIAKNRILLEYHGDNTIRLNGTFPEMMTLRGSKDDEWEIIILAKKVKPDV